MTTAGGVKGAPILELEDAPPLHPFLSGLVDPQPGDRVLDLGCGAGGTLKQMALDCPGDLRLIGLDISTETLVAARTALRDARVSDRVQLVQADANDRLGFEDGVFHKVVCHNVLECLPKPELVLAEVRRIMRPGGRLVLSHTDFDTVVFNSTVPSLTREIVHRYADRQQPWMAAADGLIGRRLPGLVSPEFELVGVHPFVLTGLSYQPGSYPYEQVRHMVRTLADALPVREIERWRADLEQLAEQGAFFYSENVYAVIARPRSGPG